MADTTNSESISVPGVPRIRDPQFRDAYANTSLIGVTPFDITMTFAKVGDMAGQTVQVDQVAVTMSPQHFKGFCKSLNETLEAYESAYGQLTIPESVTRPLRSAAQIVAKISEGQKTLDDLRLKIAADDATSSTEKKPPSKRSRGAGKA